jgi:glycogen phosphorylase
MIENINFWTGIHASLLRIVKTDLAVNRRKWYGNKRNISNITPIRASSRHRVKFQRYLALLDPAVIPLKSRQKIKSIPIHPCQWLLENAPLASLVKEAIGDRWIGHSEDLQQLITVADDVLFQSTWRLVKREHKQVLADELHLSQGVSLNIDSLFDLQLQPICNERRQMLNILHIIALFCRLKDNPRLDIVPRTFIFGHVGERAPDPDILIIIQSLAAILATDPDVSDKLQVVYVPREANLGEQMYRAADLTEEIATATLEDVDLNKLKFAANGVISIGSLGKTNHFVRETVGAENYFSFGLAIPEITLFQTYGYDPYNYYKHYPEVRRAIDYLLTGALTPENLYKSSTLVNMLLGADTQMVIADYVFYLNCQNQVSEIYRQPSVWARMSILNVAGLG